MTDEVVDRLRALQRAFNDPTSLAAMAADEIERLRKERDEARRRLCVEIFEVEGHPSGWNGVRGAAGIAERLGWDCFKEAGR